ncbi:hypothetical protein FUAX_41180 (plasmid) [Fulvitalea axinellae]|uniref:Leucine-rich repeat domain-containing protein n=1 Tax=Fulvitalea axinellae TaxID=1182444 RepID=A0AAU9CR96_9BACT|nr:hypothetical protein FUAX_41180 [Fulvitalea axinellae]
MRKDSIDPINNAIKKIEEALQITLEEDNSELVQEHTYKCYSDRRIDNLSFSNLTFENFDALAPVFRMVNHLKFVNCTIKNVSELLKLRYVNHLTLDGVTLEDIYSPDVTPADTRKCHFQVVDFINMDVKHISCIRSISKNLEYLHFTNCRLWNFYELNLLPKLYSLNLTNVFIHKSPDDIIHKTDLGTTFLSFHEMEINDFNFFLPIVGNAKIMDLYASAVKSLEGILNFPKLEMLNIDVATTVEVMTPPRETKPYRLKECSIDNIESEDDDMESINRPVFDLRTLASISPNIGGLKLDQYHLSNLDFLEQFIQLDTLEIKQSKVDFNDFLPVAHQIINLDLDTCKLKNTASLKHYKRLELIEVRDGYFHGKEIKTLNKLKRLLPLKNHLKKLCIWENDIKGIKHIEKFTALESLLLLDASVRNTERIFSMPSLKRLNISIENKQKCTFNLKGIRNIEWLVVHADKKVKLKGLKHLKRLERLELEEYKSSARNIHRLKALKYFKCNSVTDINKVGTIKTLQTLVLDISEEYNVKGLEQFPNLEYLSIRGGGEISLGKMEKLKVLDMEGGYPEKMDFLTNLPNLEKLDLGLNGFKEVPNLETLTNLRVLSLAENSIENIEGLQHLKRLEQLNLFCNDISDIRILNTLPNLKEVNLAGNPIALEKKDIKAQLKKTEIAIFYSLPYVPFRIWKNDYFNV